MCVITMGLSHQTQSNERKPVNEELGIFSLGARLIDHQALTRVESYSRALFGSSGREIEHEGWFLSIVPPFRTTFDLAVRSSMQNASEVMLATHYISTTMFCIRGIELVEHEEGVSLVFPVEAHRTKGIRDWESYVLEKMRKLSSLGASFRGEERSLYSTRIPVRENIDPSMRHRITQVIRESKSEAPLYFRATNLAVYAHYPSGWDVLLPHMQEP